MRYQYRKCNRPPPVQEWQSFQSSGRELGKLVAKDQVRWGSATAEVLSLKQSMTPRAGAEVLATFKDSTPALIVGPAGKGRVYCAGFLPGLTYVKSALNARSELEDKIAQAQPVSDIDRARVAGSYNPWEYPASIRALILSPVAAAKVAAPIRCDVPLVDAVYMPSEQGVLIPLANYTLSPLEKLSLGVLTEKPVSRIESVRYGKIEFTTKGAAVEFALPLQAMDFVKIYYRP